MVWLEKEVGKETKCQYNMIYDIMTANARSPIQKLNKLRNRIRV